VTLDALVAQVEQVLGRAHALFGEPPVSGGSTALGAGSRLAGARESVRGTAQQMSSLTGDMSTRYGVFAADAESALGGLNGADNGLGAALDHAALGDRSGRTASGVVVAGASADTASLAPVSGTPAGQKALIAALRARVAQQHQVVAAFRARDAQLAALLRSLGYARASGGAAGSPAMPKGLGGGMPGAGGLLSGLSGLTGMPTRRHRPPRAALVSRIDRRADAVPGGPGEVAVRAALGKRGRPYVWGAKGPNSFDCSGLTGWAWRQAGIQLGADTYAQIRDGVAVPPGQVRAGDLIFPRDCFDARGPGHVQLAISPTQVVHAPQPGDVVRIAPMPSSYVARRPVPLLEAPK
jgi:cell wall-associated NlpC family hydrolase